MCVWVSGRSKPEKPLLLLCLRSSKLPEGMLGSANFLSLNKSLFVGAAKWSSQRRVVAEEVSRLEPRRRRQDRAAACSQSSTLPPLLLLHKCHQIGSDLPPEIELASLHLGREREGGVVGWEAGGGAAGWWSWLLHTHSPPPPVAAGGSSCGGLRPRGQAWPLLPLWPLLRQRTGREAASITLGLSGPAPTNQPLVRGTEVGASREGCIVSRIGISK